MSPGCEVKGAVRDTVHVGSLEVDRAPVTNARYEVFVAATGHRRPLYWPHGTCPASLRDHPVVGVDFFDAVAFALWAGGCLPTEVEWAVASGLDEPRAYVWGDEFSKALCNTVRSEVKGTTPVGTYPPAPSGCVDLCGNVWEMTCNAYPGDDEAIIVKGGSWYDYPAHAKLDTQFAARANHCGNTIGFRLVYGRAMRLPAFTNTDLVAECIAFRRETQEPVPEEEHDSSEFTDVVSQLREQARVTVPGLAEDSPDVDAEAVDEALELFDELEFEPEELFLGWESKAKPAAPSAPSLVERMQTLVARRPRTVLTVALTLAMLLVWSASAEMTSTRAERGAAAEDDDRPRTEGAAAKRPERTRPARLADQPDRTPLEQALHTLRHGTKNRRDEAERLLILLAEPARAAVEKALSEQLPPHVRASFLFVLAALAEREPGPVARPRLLTAPPREGLVIFFSRVDGTVTEEIVKLRCTAAAEKLPVTLIYLGDADTRDLARTYKGTFRDAPLYIDRDKTLATLWGATRLPAVAGVRRGGGLAFIHLGRIPRFKLAQHAAQLSKHNLG